MMKKAIVCIFICLIVVLGSVVQISGAHFEEASSFPIIQDIIQYDDFGKIMVDLKIELDKVTSKQDALVLVSNAIRELYEQGLFSKGVSEKQMQRLVTRFFSKPDFGQLLQENNENGTGNANCLVIGFSNETFFRPFPTIYDIPIIHYLMFNTSFGTIFNFLVWFYAFRAFQPFKFGPYAYVGDRYRLVENGNVTYESMDASSGWVWTIGMNGVSKWNGTFYGGLYTKYQKFVSNNTSYAESWQPVGIRGYFGINVCSFLTFFMSNYIPTFFVGYARHINFTYTPPWT